MFSRTSDDAYNLSFDLPLDVNSDSALINDSFTLRFTKKKNVVSLIQKLHCNELMGNPIPGMTETVCLRTVQKY